jgi:hypothetical protein
VQKKGAKINSNSLSVVVQEKQMKEKYNCCPTKELRGAD